jgi:hypothetical protein
MFLRLQEDEALYFLHIPKTAGGTLIYTLDNYFDQQDIFPALLLSDLLKTPDLLERINQSRFIRGHFDAVTLSLIQRPLRVFTFLRNPVERTLSQFAHVSRHPEVAYWDSDEHFNHHISLDDFLQTPQAEEFLANIQVRSLTSEWSGVEKLRFWDTTSPVMPDETRLALARRRLDTCVVVGIQERFDDSLRLLAYTFGFPMPEQVNNYNVSGERVQSTALSDTARDRLRALNQLDEALYHDGCERFERDYQVMRETLDRHYPGLRGDIDAQLAADYQQRRQQRNTTSAGGVQQEWRYDFGQPLIGTNWYRREPFQNRFFCWTGPETRSTLRYLLPAHQAYQMEIETLGAVSMEALESFHFRVNEVEIPLQRVGGEFGPLFKGVIPQEALAGHHQHVLAFIVEQPVRVETRTLGLSVLSLRFTPVPQT